jgi:hypothetical protein
MIVIEATYQMEEVLLNPDSKEECKSHVMGRGNVPAGQRGNWATAAQGSSNSSPTTIKQVLMICTITARAPILAGKTSSGRYQRRLSSGT